MDQNINSQGKFIVFEGGEGAGKSTLVSQLKQELEKLDYDVIQTQEPGGTSLGWQIRELLLRPKYDLSFITETFLFLADRADHVERVIKPALEQKKIILCDRFSGSTFAYQYFAKASFEIKDQNRKDEFLSILKQADQLARQKIEPDLVIYLDLPPEIGIQRISQDQTRKFLTSFEKKELDFHKRIRRGFLNLAQENKNWIVIDARLSPEEVFKKAFQEIKKVL